MERGLVEAMDKYHKKVDLRIKKIKNMDLKRKKNISQAINVSNEFLKSQPELTRQAIYLNGYESHQTSTNDSDCEQEDDEGQINCRNPKTAFTKGETKYSIEGDIGAILRLYSKIQFQEHFHLSRKAFDKLLSLIEPQLEKRPTGPEQQIDIEHQLLATIWLLATSESYRSVSERFNLPKTSLVRSFYRIVSALNNLSTSVIQWPNEEERHQNMSEFRNFGGLRNVIGAIDAKHIPIKSPKKNTKSFINKKKYSAIALQAICDPSLKFIDCSVGHPGSMQDAQIFNNSQIFRLIETNKDDYCPGNAVILGDKAYPINTWCIPPFKDSGNLSPKQSEFNRVHVLTRQVTERCFALFFGRWRRLHYLDMEILEKMPNTIMACCVIHNVCLMFEDDMTEKYIRDGRMRAKESETNSKDSSLGRKLNGLLVRKRMVDDLWHS